MGIVVPAGSFAPMSLDETGLGVLWQFYSEPCYFAVAV